MDQKKKLISMFPTKVVYHYAYHDMTSTQPIRGKQMPIHDHPKLEFWFLLSVEIAKIKPL
jgi:hypothetical protein